jgi:hypothetical protein
MLDLDPLARRATRRQRSLPCPKPAERSGERSWKRLRKQRGPRLPRHRRQRPEGKQAMRAQAAHARLARGVRPSRRRRRGSSVARAGGSWPGGQASPWSSQSVAPGRRLTSHVDPEVRCGRAAETRATPCWRRCPITGRHGAAPMTEIAVVGEPACLRCEGSPLLTRKRCR